MDSEKRGINIVLKNMPDIRGLHFIKSMNFVTWASSFTKR